jgi:hypothetical protein
MVDHPLACRPCIAVFDLTINSSISPLPASVVPSSISEAGVELSPVG